MTRFKELVREPALLISLVESLVLLFVAFGAGLSGDQQSYIVAASVAVLGLLKAFLTRPFVVAALTDAARAVLVLVASFGVGLTADQIAMLVMTLGLITTVIIRGQITPANSPVTDVTGSGAGPVTNPPVNEPVRNEGGFINLGGDDDPTPDPTPEEEPGEEEPPPPARPYEEGH